MIPGKSAFVPDLLGTLHTAYDKRIFNGIGV